MIGEITGTGNYPQYYASPSAEQEFVLENESEGCSAEFYAWMYAHPDVIWLRWKDGVTVGDEKALKDASIDAIIRGWIQHNIEVKTENGTVMFRRIA